MSESGERRLTEWIRLTKTDHRAVDVNLSHAHSVLRDERNYSTLITFGPADTVTVLETPDEIARKVGKRAAQDQVEKPAAA
jgi:hypothetical protein